jgi:hypothetical protein
LQITFILSIFDCITNTGTLVKTKIHTLTGENDFCLIAIASHLSDYKISWLLNEEFNFRFSQSDDLIVSETKTNNNSKFTVFLFEDTDSAYTLFSIRSGNNVLLKSIKNIDYILKYHGPLSDNHIDNLMDRMKKMKNILTVFKIDLKSLKPKEIELFS